MPAVLPFILGGLATGGVTAGAQAIISHQNKQAGDRARHQADDKANAQMAEAKNRQENEESQAAAMTARDQARRRQRQLSMGARGRRDTILTGPSGLGGPSPAAPQTAQKTTLGA